MATTHKQVIAVLSKLAAYYSKEPTEEQAIIYLDALSRLEPSVLNESARLWINRSPFFPKVSELLQIAGEIPVLPRDDLVNMVMVLEHAFYHDRTLDEQAWLDLANAFYKADRPYRARHTLQTLAAYQSILEQESKIPSSDGVVCDQERGKLSEVEPE
jgi:hypothetical protein